MHAQSLVQGRMNINISSNPKKLEIQASFIYDVVQSAAAGHVHQNSSAHMVRSGHLDAAAVLARTQWGNSLLKRWHR